MLYHVKDRTHGFAQTCTNKCISLPIMICGLFLVWIVAYVQSCDDAARLYCYDSRIVQVFLNHFSDDSRMLYLIKDSNTYALAKHIQICAHDYIAAPIMIWACNYF